MTDLFYGNEHEEEGDRKRIIQNTLERGKGNVE